MGGRERAPCTPSRDGYFLECRKDAQCDCSMCKASIHATRDLRPSNTLLGSITNTVDSASPSPLKMPGKENHWPLAGAPDSAMLSPHLKELSRLTGVWNPRAQMDSQSQLVKKKGAIHKRRGLLLLFFVIAAVEFVQPWVICHLLEPHLSAESVRRLAEASLARKRLVDRLDFVGRKVSRAVHSASVSNCTGMGPRWRLTEDGYFVHSFCKIYSASIEKVTVWGYTGKTGGVLGRSLVDRSFTVLSGRAVEWREGQIEYVVHPEGSSWIMPKWAASAILLDGNTWILEYKRTALFEGFGGVSGILHLAKRGLVKVARNVKSFMDTAFFAPVQSIQFTEFRVPPT